MLFFVILVLATALAIVARRREPVRGSARIGLGVAMAFAGAAHLFMPTPFVQHLPEWAPARTELIYFTGVLEIGLGAALVGPARWRQLAGLGLASYLVAVFPSNVYVAVEAIDVDGQPGGLYPWIRLPFQALFVGLALWSTDALQALRRPLSATSRLSQVRLVVTAAPTPPAGFPSSANTWSPGRLEPWRHLPSSASGQRARQGGGTMKSPGITERLARFSARRRWTMVGLWVALFIVGGVLASGIGNVLTTEMRLSNNPESQRANALIEERLPQLAAAREVVIVSSDQMTVDHPAFQSFVTHLVAEARELDGIVAGSMTYYETGEEALVSRDRHHTIVPIIIAGERSDAAEHAEPLLDLLAEKDGEQGFQVVTAGGASISHLFNETSEKDLQSGEMKALPIAIIVLLVVFGAAVAAGVPILVALLSIVVATGTAALVGRAFDLSFFVVNMITMIGLAVGIDYSLFIVERFRQERREGLPTSEAVARAGATASRAVLFSGGTVVIALAGLFIVPSTVYRSLAVGAIAVATVAVVAALTLLPAVLALLGDRVNAIRPPFVGRFSSGTGEGPWAKVTAVVMNHPAISTIAAVVLLISAAVPTVGLNMGQAGVSTLPPGSGPRTAFEILDREFSGGLISPAEVVVAGDLQSPDVQQGIERLTARLGNDPIFGTAMPQSDEDGSLLVLSFPIAGDPDGDEAHDAIRRLRGEYIPEAFGGVPATVLVTGSTAEGEDLFATISQYTPYVFAFVLGLSFILLLVLFRSIVVPVKALAMNLLSVGAAYGLLVLVFQHGVGADLLGFQRTETIEAWLPLFLFTVLFGLSMDYHVFLLSRIKERFDQTGNNREAVAYGMRTTSGIITGAALIMVAVFAGFATGELASMQQMGFGLAVAVILDATVIRSILVPASMQLLGDRNWYLPDFLGWLPHFEVEGAAAQPALIEAVGGE